MSAEASPPARPRAGARERARRAVASEISQLALDLFSAQGYDNTTVEDVCAAANISRTTFFRYFRSKEDVLMRDFDGLGDDLAAALAAQPNHPAAWAAFSAALGVLAARYSSSDAQTRRALQIVIDTPSLTAFHHEKLSRWVEQVRPEVSRRLGAEAGDRADPAPAALINAGFACLDAALASWVAAQGQVDLAVLVARAVAAVGAPAADGTRAAP